MVPGFFNYSAILNRAMQQVVRSILSYVSENGLPGQHHFYITFSTTMDGVVLPSRARARYPEQITIVLQHEFYNLEVEENSFAVDLVFDGLRERVVVPLGAIIDFSDHFANFSMQLSANEWSGGVVEYDDGDASDDGVEAGVAGSEHSSDGVMSAIVAELSEKISGGIMRFIGNGQEVQEEEKKSEDDNGRMGDLIFIDDYLNKG